VRPAKKAAALPTVSLQVDSRGSIVISSVLLVWHVTAVLSTYILIRRPLTVPVVGMAKTVF
jgi:hypothetical protein